MARILLVESDPLQAYQRTSVLERQFCDVHRVPDAVEALCLVEQPQFASSLCLVVCGQHMTGIGGPAFIAELHARLPWVPVLVLGAQGEASTPAASDREHYLAWPYSAEEMLAAAGQLAGEPARFPA